MMNHRDEEFTFGPMYKKYFYLHYEKENKIFLLPEENTQVTKRKCKGLCKSLRRWRECDRDRSSNVLYQSGGSQIVKESKRSRRKKDDRIRNQGTDV